jgi:CHAP domain
MQSDGNVVLYGSSGALWSTGTWGTQANQLTLQNDGDLVLSSPAGTLWSTMYGPAGALRAGTVLSRNTLLLSPNGQYKGVVQSDGNFVVYGPNGAVWSTRTFGTTGNELIVQSDGNVVLYGSSGAVWSTGTWGTQANSLALQNDGSLVLSGNSGMWWSSGSGTSFVSKLVQRAASEDQNYAAVAETPPGSNCNPFTAFWGAGDPTGCAPGTSAEGWCSDFAAWVWYGVGVNTTGITGWSYTFVNWGQANNTWKPGATNDPQPGDAVVFGTTAGDGYGAHVGIVTGVDGNQIDTINGNWADAVMDAGYFDPSTTTVDGYPVIGYISPTNLSTGAPVTQARTVHAATVTQQQINSQDGGK